MIAGVVSRQRGLFIVSRACVDDQVTVGGSGPGAGRSSHQSVRHCLQTLVRASGNL